MIHPAKRTFAAVPTSVPQARKFVLSRAALNKDPQAFEVALLTSELAENAIRFGGGEQFGVKVANTKTGGKVVRVEVSDGSAEIPFVKAAGPEEEGGRGLLLVDKMASSWGVDLHSDAAKTVWFEV